MFQNPNNKNILIKEGRVVKAWGTDTELFIEGWLSTPALDYERDVTDPEAFMDCMESYFERCAPLSIVHNGKNIPTGHIQKAAILKDGKILKEAAHPIDARDFQQQPNEGNGVWIRAVINEPTGIQTIRKGNTRGLSFMANSDVVEEQPGGRYRYKHFDHWMESTIAPYPINPTTVFQVAKAFGLQGEPPSMTPEEIAALVAQTLKTTLDEREQAQVIQAKKAAEDGRLTAIAQENETLKAQVAELGVKVEKAMIPSRGEGVGSKQVVKSATELMEEDPAGYIVQKAQSGEALTLVEKDLIAELTKAAWFQGMEK